MSLDLLACSMRFTLKRLGLLGVAAFALKGVLWLTIPALLAMRGCAPEQAEPTASIPPATTAPSSY